MKTKFMSTLNKLRPFYFDNQELSYKRTKGLFFLILLSISIVSFFTGWVMSEEEIIPKKVKQITPEEKLIILKSGDEFSEEKLILFINELNFKWPEIAYAQARQESGEKFNSDINLQNHNYFGMKKANVRANTQIGENLGHAVYMNWRMSVMDYALNYSSFLFKCENKAQYYNYLATVYCTTPGYVESIQSHEKEYFIKLEKIKEKSSYDFFEPLKDSISSTSVVRN